MVSLCTLMILGIPSVSATAELQMKLCLMNLMTDGRLHNISYSLPSPHVIIIHTTTTLSHTHWLLLTSKYKETAPQTINPRPCLHC